MEDKGLNAAERPAMQPRDISESDDSRSGDEKPPAPSCGNAANEETKDEIDLLKDKVRLGGNHVIVSCRI